MGRHAMKSSIKPLMMSCKLITLCLLVVSTLTLSLNTQAFEDKTADRAIIRQFSESDERYLQQGRDRINELTRRHLGSRFQQQQEHDVALLQRLLDEQLVSTQDSRLLQDMGIILGDLLILEFDLRWVIYVDKYGPSRALQLKLTENVLFPITMISRRAEVGLEVDIAALYQQAEKKIAAYKAAARRFY